MFSLSCTKLGFPILSVSHYICREPLDPMGIHLFRYAHGGEKITSHDVWDVLVAIVKNAKFHILRNQTHVISPLTLQVSHCRVDIVLLINGLCTLANVIIADPFKLVWFQRQLCFCEDVVTIAIQTKDGFYHDQVLTNMFLLPTIKVFKCLHQQEK